MSQDGDVWGATRTSRSAPAAPEQLNVDMSLGLTGWVHPTPVSTKPPKKVATEYPTAEAGLLTPPVSASAYHATFDGGCKWPDLPNEVWARVFHHCLTNYRAESRHIDSYRALRLPLVNKRWAEISTPLLYCHPTVTYGKVSEFLRSLRDHPKYRNLVRELSICPSPTSNCIYPSVAPDADKIHADFSLLFDFLPNLDSLTIRSADVSNPSDIARLFDGLRKTRPRKARLELRIVPDETPIRFSGHIGQPVWIPVQAPSPPTGFPHAAMDVVQDEDDVDWEAFADVDDTGQEAEVDNGAAAQQAAQPLSNPTTASNLPVPVHGDTITVDASEPHTPPTPVAGPVVPVIPAPEVAEHAQVTMETGTGRPAATPADNFTSQVPETQRENDLTNVLTQDGQAASAPEAMPTAASLAVGWVAPTETPPLVLVQAFLPSALPTPLPGPIVTVAINGLHNIVGAPFHARASKILEGHDEGDQVTLHMQQQIQELLLDAQAYYGNHNPALPNVPGAGPGAIAATVGGWQTHPAFVGIVHVLRKEVTTLFKSYWQGNTSALSLVPADHFSSNIFLDSELKILGDLRFPHLRLSVPQDVSAVGVFHSHQASVGNVRQGFQRESESLTALDLLHEDVKLFEVEVASKEDMRDERWTEEAAHLPPQLCRIFKGQRDWEMVEFDPEWTTASLPASPPMSYSSVPDYDIYGDDEYDVDTESEASTESNINPLYHLELEEERLRTRGHHSSG